MDIAGVPVEGSWIMQGGAVGMLGLVALMVFLGRLVPRRTYDDLVRDRDYWRQAALQAMGHTEALMPVAEIATRVTEALGAAAGAEQAIAARRGQAGAS